MTTMTQRTAALTRANRIRLDRCALKARIHAGTESIGEVIREPPECAITMPLGTLLRAQRGWGGTRTRRFLASAEEMSEVKQVGSLTERQRRVIRCKLGVDA